MAACLLLATLSRTLAQSDAAFDNLFQATTAFSTPDLTPARVLPRPIRDPAGMTVFSVESEPPKDTTLHERTMQFGIGHDSNPLRKLARDAAAYVGFAFEDALHMKRGPATWKLSANADTTSYEHGDRNFNKQDVHLNAHLENPLQDKLRLKTHLRGAFNRLDERTYNRFWRWSSDFIHVAPQYWAALNVNLERRDGRLEVIDPRTNRDAFKAVAGPVATFLMQGPVKGRLSFAGSWGQTFARGSDEDLRHQVFTVKLAEVKLSANVKLEALEIAADKRRGKVVHSRSTVPRDEHEMRATSKWIWVPAGGSGRSVYRLDVGCWKLNSTIAANSYHRFDVSANTVIRF